MAKDIRTLLDNSKILEGYGNTRTAVANVLRGINHRGSGNIVPPNTDGQGYTFFTRPNLNLGSENIAMARRLTFLNNTDDTSMACAIRSLLSPQVIDHWGMSLTPDDGLLPRSRIIDDRYPFIPLLTNTLLNISGWPDFVLDAFTAPAGLRKETVSWADSIGDMYTNFDLSANFMNIDGDPITALFAVWTEYASRVAEGSMNPYAQCVIENEVDYQTRIYRIILDPTKTQVRKIADVGVAYPSAVPIGAGFNYSSDSLFGTESTQLGIRFSCTGVRYNDPITIFNFNRTVETFNPSMRKGKRETDMVRLSQQEMPIFNYMGYPRITDDNLFEWWVSKEDYAAMKAVINPPADRVSLGEPSELGTLDSISSRRTNNLV